MRPTQDPGLPLSTLAGQHRCDGVRLSCIACGRSRDLPFETVVSDLEARGVGGWLTPIREVAEHARKPCVCGAMAWETAPWWR